MKNLLLLSLLASLIAISGCCSFKTGLTTSDYTFPTTSLERHRTYEQKYDDVFDAAYNAARAMGLKVRVADRQMGAIIADKHIGAYNSRWHDNVGIFLKKTGENETLVLVKYTPMREGSAFVPFDVQTEHNAAFAAVSYKSGSMKVNKVFSNIEDNLDINDIWGVRGLASW
jgi:hypothetical protein